MSIQKLELVAAVIGSRLLKHLKSYISFSQATLWSDSQITLSWLMTKKQVPIFVKNRVTEINQLTHGFSWRYCPTDSNPADLLSRGMTAVMF
ncbi:Hypothetical predicted protein [Mytilus galloprovincialis]|uniref:RNase H type-1 domain-containing protein n=1 Tax=Mytilus galloprovincialis TaxID=29158 RepID=A0A8B6ENG5_MYTGA|nr:Hypothetical predicted protein [Mytilus galloprovincialis]